MKHVVKDGLLAQTELLARGADGHLYSAFERYVPISKLDGLEPEPSNNESDDGEYHAGRKISQPIEIQYSSSDDSYIVFGGNHRVAQAKANGQTHILAFVEPDPCSLRSGAGRHAIKYDPDAVRDIVQSRGTSETISDSGAFIVERSPSKRRP